VTLFQLDPGSVVAPAGCGKTQTIVDAFDGYEGLPVLVLTHTNAGVSALRARFARAGVHVSKYKLYTLDGWALRLISVYPKLAGHVNPDGQINYPATQDGAIAVLESGAIDPVLRASYGRLVVDEYQDCSERQHRLIRALRDVLECHVLGDPLQCIFNFNAGTHPDWEVDVMAAFPVVRELDQPHRWLNAEQGAFGQWILDCRETLLAGGQIDLDDAPANVQWKELPDAGAAREAAYEAAISAVDLNAGRGLLIIGDPFPVQRRLDFARAHAGVQVIEPVDLSDLIVAAGSIGATENVDQLVETLQFADAAMTDVLHPLAERVNALLDGEDVPVADLLEAACLKVCHGEGLRAVREVLERLHQSEGRHVYRPHLLSTMIAALSRSMARNIRLREAAIAEREAQRVKGRPLPKKGIGSTLLVKGLETDHAIVLNANTMTPAHLYVAISRASTSLTVFSSSAHLPLG
jgi:DNA helicase-2/ATP-dependent DNA helicase PcrA